MNISRTITTIAFILVGLGLLEIGSASSLSALRNFGNQWYFFRTQLTAAALGFLAFYIFSRMNIEILLSFHKYFFYVSVILLIVDLLPGVGTTALGTRRWLSLGFINLQPSELAKFLLGFHLSHLMKVQIPLINYFVQLGIIIMLVLMQPDLGTASIIFAGAVSVYMASGREIKKILPVFAIIGILITFYISIAPYRLARLTSFFSPQSDPQGSSYQVSQAVLAVGNGGLFGTGLGRSLQKYEYLPEITTDTTFALIAEELGLLGSLGIILIFALIFYMGILVSRQLPDIAYKSLTIYISSFLTVQALINISGNIALLPFTGVPLPLLSFGGTSLVVNLSALGILNNLSKKAYG